MDSMVWGDPAMEMKLEIESKFDAADWPSSSGVKTEGYMKINVKQETESLDPEELQHSREVEEPTLALVKSEYEVQENYLDSTRNTIENDAEEQEDDDNDDGDYDNGFNDNNDVDYSHEGLGDLSDTDDDEKNYVEPKNLAKNNKRSKKNPTKDSPTFYQRRRNFFDKYVIRYCPVCGIELDTHSKWIAHTNTEHNLNIKDSVNYTYLDNRKAKCNQCNELVIRKCGNLKAHMLAHLPYTKIFKCKLCTVATTKHCLLIKHIESRHFDVVGKALTPLMDGNPYYNCAYCGKYVGDVLVLSNHIQSEHAEIYEHKLLHVCPACGEQFENDLSHKKHLEDQHQFHTLAGLSLEIVEQKDKKIFRCLRCSHVFHSNTPFYRLKDHAFTHAAYKLFKCRYCEFGRPKKTRVITHTCNSLLMDLKCNPMFPLMSKTSNRDIPKEVRQRKSTLKTDSSDKLYVCPSCGENFNDQVSWDRHLTQVHKFDKFEALNVRIESSADGIIKYVCTLCDKQFNTSNRNNIRVHAFHHMPHKIYKCKLCQASLNSMGTCSCKKSNVKTAFIFVCPKCSIEFSTEKNWRRHIVQIHKFNRPSGLNFSKVESDKNEIGSFKCADCSEVIKESTTMVRRMFLHASVMHMPYKCYKCINCRELCDSKDSMSEHAYHCKIKNGMGASGEDEADCSKFARCQCNVCDYLGDSEEHVTTHLHEEHLLKNAEQLNISWLCTICEHKCDSENEIRDHILKNHINFKPTEAASDLLIFHCPACELEFRTKLEWQTHIFEQHALNTMVGLRLEDLGKDCKCLDCGLVFKQVNSNKLLHRMQHLPNKPYKCSKCLHSYINLSFTIKHALSCDGTLKSTSKLKILHSDEHETNQYPEAKVTEKEQNKEIKQEKRKKAGNKPEEPLTDPLDLDEITNSSNEKLGLFHKYWEHISFACPECNMKFLSHNAWYSHITTEHEFFSEEQMHLTFLPDEKHKLARCIECSVNVHGSAFQAHRHKLTHMPYPAFVCNLCTHRSRTQNVLVYHIQRQHFTVGEFKCVLCDFVFNTSYERFSHTRAEHADAEWPNNVCHICMKVLLNRWNLSDHMKMHEFNREIFECGFCERKYYRSSERKKHWMQYHPVEFASSNQGGENMVVLETAKDDTDSNPNKESHPNDTITLTVKEDECQNIGEGANNVEENYEEPLDFEDTNTDSEKMAGYGQYWEHISFACPECNKPFLSRNVWYSHITTEHEFFSEKQINITPLPGEKRKVARCNECGVNVYGSPFQSQRHKLTHMPYQAFICKICNHRSRTQNVLIYHIQRRHFTAGEFKCVLCHVVLNTSYERVVHTKTEHTDAEWPDNACQICMRVLKNQIALRDHLKTHDFNREIFECGFCERKYYHANERRLHMMHYHPVEFASIDLEKKMLVAQKVPNVIKRKLAASKKKVS